MTTILVFDALQLVTLGIVLLIAAQLVDRRLPPRLLVGIGSACYIGLATVYVLRLVAAGAAS